MLTVGDGTRDGRQEKKNESSGESAVTCRGRAVTTRVLTIQKVGRCVSRRERPTRNKDNFIDESGTRAGPLKWLNSERANTHGGTLPSASAHRTCFHPFTCSI